MKRRIAVTYHWQNVNNPEQPVKVGHIQALEATANEQIFKGLSEGYFSGELNDTVRFDESDGEDGIAYRGWWEEE